MWVGMALGRALHVVARTAVVGRKVEGDAADVGFGGRRNAGDIVGGVAADVLVVEAGNYAEAALGAGSPSAAVAAVIRGLLAAKLYRSPYAAAAGPLPSPGSPAVSALQTTFHPHLDP